MKRVVTSIIPALMVSVFTVTGYTEIVDRIVAVVNTAPITEFQIQQTQQTLRQQGAPPDVLERDAVMNFLIEQEVVLQEAQKKGVLVTDVELQTALDDVKRQNNLTSDEQLKNALAREGRTLTEFLDDIRRQIRLAKIVGQEVRSRVEVSESEVEVYYREHREEFGPLSPEPGVAVSQILLTVPDDATPAQIDQIRVEATSIVQQLRAGADFKEMATRYSQHPSAASGGELGVFQPGQLAAPFDIAFTLQSGEISDPVRSENGFHIFTVRKDTSAQQEEIDRIKAQIRNILFDQKAEQRYAEWIAELKDEAYIDIK